MGGTHRVLYVGSVTGVHIGKELEVALQRDRIPDGKALIRKGGAFKKLSPYQLPDYIQSLYFDFLLMLNKFSKNIRLNTKLIEKNATEVKASMLLEQLVIGLQLKCLG